MSDKAKSYRVVGIDLDIDGERVPEGSEIELVAEPPRKLARWLELLRTVEPATPAKSADPIKPAELAIPAKPSKPAKPADPAKAETPAKDAPPAGENQDGEGGEKKTDDNAEETKA